MTPNRRTTWIVGALTLAVVVGVVVTATGDGAVVSSEMTDGVAQTRGQSTAEKGSARS